MIEVKYFRMVAKLNICNCLYIFCNATLVWRCLLGLPPAYLRIFAVPPRVPDVAAPSSQWNGGVLSVSFARTSTRQTRALLMVGSSVWNGLPLAFHCSQRYILSDSTLVL